MQRKIGRDTFCSYVHLYLIDLPSLNVMIGRLLLLTLDCFQERPECYSLPLGQLANWLPLLDKINCLYSRRSLALLKLLTPSAFLPDPSRHSLSSSPNTYDRYGWGNVCPTRWCLYKVPSRPEMTACPTRMICLTPWVLPSNPCVFCLTSCNRQELFLGRKIATTLIPYSITRVEMDIFQPL